MDELSKNVCELLDKIIAFTVSIETLYKRFQNLEETKTKDKELLKQNQEYLEICLEVEEEKYQDLFSRNFDSEKVINYIYTKSIEQDTSDEVIDRIKNKIDNFELRKKLRKVSQEKDSTVLFMMNFIRSVQIDYLTQSIYKMCDFTVKMLALEKMQYVIDKTESNPMKSGLLEKKYQLLLQNPDMKLNGQDDFSLLEEMNLLSHVLPEKLKTIFVGQYFSEKAIYYLSSLLSMTKRQYYEDRADATYQIFILDSLVELMSDEAVKTFYDSFLTLRTEYKVLPSIEKQIETIFEKKLKVNNKIERREEGCNDISPKKSKKKK